MPSTPRLAPPRPATLLHVAALTTPLALVVLGCKAHKVLHETTGFVLADLLLALAPDVLFLAIWSLVWTALLHVSRGPAYWVASAFFSVATFVMLFVAFGEHQFYLSTGSLLDWTMMAYTFEHLGMLTDVLASEVGIVVWGGTLLTVALVVSPLFLRRASWVREHLDTQRSVEDWGDGRIRRGWKALAVVGLVTLVMGSATIRDELEPFAGNVYSRLGAGLFAGQAQGKVLDVDVQRHAALQLKETAKVKRHNVVVIALESARARSFTPYTPDLNTTPFFAKLAKRGTLFERAYTTVTHTSKALVSIHCGIYPLIDTPVSEAAAGAIPAECLAAALKKKGYATAFMQPAEENFERRADLVEEFGFDHFKGKESLPSEGFDESNYFGWEDDVMVQPALDWIDAQQQDKKPFYLGLLTLAGHHPYKIPNGFKTQTFSNRETVDNYLNTIAYTDRFLSKLFAGFEARGLMDNTIFVLLGDHGEGMGEHGRQQHDSVIYEEGVHIPLLVIGPGVPKGLRKGGLRQTIDVLPTVLETLGYDMSGTDLPGLGLLSSRGHQQVFTSCWYHDYCMAKTTQKHKIIYHFDRRKPQVFDLVADPDERKNLAKTVDKTVIATAIEDMERWRATANARFEASDERRMGDYVSQWAPLVGEDLVANIGAEVQLLGYDVDKTRIALGGKVVVTLYFKALKDVSKGWAMFTHLLGPAYHNVEHIPVDGAHPVERWRAGEYITDRVTITTRPTFKPGKYRLSIGLWNATLKGGGMAQRAEIKVLQGTAKVDAERRLPVLELILE